MTRKQYAREGASLFGLFFFFVFVYFFVDEYRKELAREKISYETYRFGVKGPILKPRPEYIGAQQMFGSDASYIDKIEIDSDLDTLKMTLVFYRAPEDVVARCKAIALSVGFDNVKTENISEL